MREESGGRKPELYEIFHGEVASLQTYGAFVKIPYSKKQGLLHKSQMSTARIDDPSEMLAKGEKVYCKIISMLEDGDKISLSMKVVNQTTGQDLDPNNVQASQDEKKRRQWNFKGNNKIELGAELNTTCRRCGGHGHLTMDCYVDKGDNQYNLVPDIDELMEIVGAEEPSTSSSTKKKKEKKKSKKKKRHRSRRSSSSETDNEEEDRKKKKKRSHSHDKDRSSGHDVVVKRARRKRSPVSDDSDSNRMRDRDNSEHITKHKSDRKREVERTRRETSKQKNNDRRKHRSLSISEESDEDHIHEKMRHEEKPERIRLSREERVPKSGHHADTERYDKQRRRFSSNSDSDSSDTERQEHKSDRKKKLSYKKRHEHSSNISNRSRSPRGDRRSQKYSESISEENARLDNNRDRERRIPSHREESSRGHNKSSTYERHGKQFSRDRNYSQ